MNKACTKCGVDQELEQFHKDPRRTDGRTSECITCYRKRQAETYKKKGAHQKKLDHYVIYYLPEEHYCGHTNAWPRRKYVHKYNGKNTDGARILFTTKTKTEAVYYEALFCSVLGLNGLKLR